MRPVIGILCSLTDGDGGASSQRDSVARAYAERILQADGAPLLVPCSDDPEAVLPVLEALQGLIITGGVDVDPGAYGQEPRRQLGSISPERDGLDRITVEYVLKHRKLPVLGICRGIQALNVFAGGTLIQDIPSQFEGALKHSQSAPGWYGTHAIQVEAGSVLAETLGETELRVNSYHHEAVDGLADEFKIVARTSDGIVEAIERERAPYCLGVQFHPELMAGRDARMMRLFSRLVKEASRV